MSNFNAGHKSGCLVCGKPIVYLSKNRLLSCTMCNHQYEANAVCEQEHYVCDNCHTSEMTALWSILAQTKEKDPIKLLHEVMELPGVHMHGPEHHKIVPGVLLAAYKNNGGDLDFTEALSAAMKRGSQVPGGACGFWGVCGAAAGAGIYASIITGSNPLNKEMWGYPQKVAARCLERMSEIGGPRCCKRTSRIATETAAQFTAEHFKIKMPIEKTCCSFHDENNECIENDCPYYGA